MADINILAPFILSFEGGFVNDPHDRGGATNRGVTLTTWKSAGYDKDGDGDIDVQDLKIITPEDAVNVVLRPHYWNRWKADDIECQSIANILVDWVWHSGSPAIKRPQALLGVVADGQVGPKTIAALNAQDPHEFFLKLKENRKAFYEGICAKNPSQNRFLKGWLRRLDAIGWGTLQDNGGKVRTFEP
jgi:lysozyme family protein